MDDSTKTCNRCNTSKPLTAFYIRSGVENPTIPGHYHTECKSCMKKRSKVQGHLPPQMARDKSEMLAIERLKQHGIHALPGKAVSAAHVDVVAFGCVWIEVKYSKLRKSGLSKRFLFNCTPKQQREGFKAQLVLLICEYEDRHTFHIFDAQHPVFYMDDRLKSGFTFTPGAMEALKHGDTRVVMTQPMMDAAEDDISHIWRVLQDYHKMYKVI